ncbi:hypothetical protein ACFO0N_07275 [Halobium salinum]|uniref:DUF7847 domain-containing protein n=1 Tax=Halobium salinum TaxID=1364940 RepID=A0ABD5PAI7_9EURY|nr:hypothetical protein [Halobium salinum]
MGALSSLRTGGRAALRNPVLFGVAALLSLLQLPQFALQLLDPWLASVGSLLFTGVFVFVLPFFMGGILGLANEAVDGETRFATFVESGKAHYVSLLAVYLAVLAVSFVFGIVVTIAAVAMGVAAVAGGSGGGLALFGVGAVVLLVALVGFLLLFFLQFYGQAIVVDDLGAVDGLKRSAAVVRRNLLSTFGYTLFVSLVGGGFGLVVGVTSALLTTPTGPAPTPAAPTVGVAQPSLALVAVLSAVVLVGGTLMGGLFSAYSVAFYRDIRGATPSV